MSKGKRSGIATTNKKAKQLQKEHEFTDVLDFGVVVQARLGGARNRLKEKLLAGARLEPGRLVAELRRLPGRNPASVNPDDYELVVSHLQ